MFRQAQVHPEADSPRCVTPSAELETAGKRGTRWGLGLFRNLQGGTLKKQQRRQVWVMVVMTLIPIVTLAILAIVLMTNSSSNNSRLSWLREEVGGSVQNAGHLVHRLQIERGRTAFYLSSRDEAEIPKLQTIYQKTDSAIANISWVNDNSLMLPDFFESKELYKDHLERFRRTVTSAITNVTLVEVITFYTNDIDVITGWLLQAVQSYDHAGGLWSKLISYQLLLLAKENAGKERAIGGTFYSRGGFNLHDDFLWFMNESVSGKTLLNTAMRFSSFLQEASEVAVDKYVVSQIDAMRSEIKLNDHQSLESSVVKGDIWFQNMTQFIDDLREVQITLGGSIIEDLDTDMRWSLYNLVACAFLLSTVLITGPLIIRGIIHQTQQIQRVGDSLHRKTLELREEKKRSDSLLYQMLPKVVAEQLKLTGQTTAETYDEVTVFFSDVANFTAMSAISTPIQVCFVYKNAHLVIMMLVENGKH
ncbi:uncharacterized protein LOC110982468 [Acanthaster planci]|uniref:guanylate cyclase n=1 Tax=Acanthaster planci TaxID=133434 RepID=A0A8B7YVQ2_ACAPL|nr:uncharacterized protein LOC110982468 [Acanthaster planci]